jgi:glycosyltransferase involved in cell wall biosynthesis
MTRLAILSSHAPQRCGIASYTRDLTAALRVLGVTPMVAAVTQAGSQSDGMKSEWSLLKDDIRGYYELGSQISRRADAFIIQHEYGLYGGRYGAYILELMRSASVPIVMTLHSVVPPPNATFLNLSRRLFSLAAVLVVPSESAAREIYYQYGVPRARIYVIPHGTHYVPVTDTLRSYARTDLKIDDYPLLVTGGFINRNKGIKYALKAMPQIRRHHPKARYVIIGAPHPADAEGDTYLRGLQTRAHDLGDAVMFVESYVSDTEMDQWLMAADLCLLPYVEPHQISSGVLARCLGLGCAVVATNFPHAQSLMPADTSALVPMKNSNAIAAAVLQLLANSDAIAGLRRYAGHISKAMSWPSVAQQYMSVVRRATCS